MEIERDFSGQEIYHLKDIRSGGNIDSNEEELIKKKKSFEKISLVWLALTAKPSIYQF